MAKNRLDEAEFAAIAKELDVPVSEVRRAVLSFFDVIRRDAVSMPFDNAFKIYLKDRFDDFVRVRNIPCIGRIGPVYSRYIKWRRNEAKDQNRVPRRSYRSGISQDEIEHIAGEILAGRTPSPVKKKKAIERFDRIWIINKEHKYMARQVVPKE